MSQQAIRGTSLGSFSLESDRNVEFSERMFSSFRCANGHNFEIPFAIDAELPDSWECRFCSSHARRVVDGEEVALTLESSNNPRSHFEMLLERRSREELEELLQERLTEMRERRAKGLPGY
ncbi:MAG: hypothetical protein RLZZ122_1167 [Actinomycetota bacterium]|jgi:hypothetical protein